MHLVLAAWRSRAGGALTVRTRRDSLGAGAEGGEGGCGGALESRGINRQGQERQPAALERTARGIDISALTVEITEV